MIVIIINISMSNVYIYIYVLLYYIVLDYILGARPMQVS